MSRPRGGDGVLLAVATWAEAWPLRRFGPRVIGVGRRPVIVNGHRAVLSAGFAGACLPELEPGDLVVTAGELAACLGACPGEIRTVTAIASPADKLRLGRQGAAAVDMETAWLRDAADAAGIPFLGVRVIIDRQQDRAASFNVARHYPRAARRLREAVTQALERWP